MKEQSPEIPSGPPAGIAALLVDLALLAGVVYAGRVIAQGVVVYLDDLVRHTILAQLPANNLDQLRAQILAHPLLLGRPAILDSLCNDFGPAALLVVYFGFLKAALNSSTPGRILIAGLGDVHRAALKKRLADLFGNLAAKFLQTLDSWIPGRSDIAGMRKHIDNIRAVFAPVRLLPDNARSIGFIILAMAAILTAATPILYSLDGRVTKVVFQDAYDKPALVPQISIYIALGGLAVGWAGALAGTCLTNLWLFAVTGLFYVFSFVFIGLTGARSWWLAVPQWMLAVLGAMIPASQGRWWQRWCVIWIFCALAVLHTLRMTPLHAISGAAGWRVILPLSVIAAFVFSQIRLRATMAASFVALAVLNLAFLAAALRSGAQIVAGNVYPSLYQLAGLLTLFWFLMGGNLIDASISLVRTLLAQAGRLFTQRWLPWLPIGLCLAELFVIAELQRFNPGFMYGTERLGQYSMRLFSLPAHEGIALMLLLIAAALAIFRQLTAERAQALIVLLAFSLFLIWSFFLSAIPILSAPPAYPGKALDNGFALLRGIEKNLSGEKQFTAFGLLTFALLWEIFAGPRRLPPQDRQWAQAPGVLLFYFGILELMTALSHFAFISGTMPPQAADAFMYSGLQALWLPMALYASFYGQTQVATPARETLIRPFFIGMLASIPECFVRIYLGDPAGLATDGRLFAVAAGQAGVFVSLLSILSYGAISSALDAAAAGVACALGLAVAHTKWVMLPLVGQVAGIVSALTGFSTGASFVQRWLSPSHMNVVAQADPLILYLAGPSSAAAIAVILWRGKQRAQTGLATGGALGVLAASALYVAPVYPNGVHWLTRDTAAPTPILIQRIYFETILYLTIPILIAGIYVYRTAWRPALIPANGRFGTDIQIRTPEVFQLHEPGAAQSR